jgi:hypothetical protein
LLSKPDEEEPQMPSTEELPPVEEPEQLPPLVAAAALDEAVSEVAQPEPAVDIFTPQEALPAEENVPLEAELIPAEPESATEPEAFAWLKGLTDEQDATMTDELVMPGPEGEVQPPDWVKLDLEPVTDVLAHPSPPAEAAEEVPDWIKGLGEEPEAEQPAEVSQEITQPEAEELAEGELPAWLVELEQPESEKEAAGSTEEPLEWEPEELPDWLKEITEAEEPQQVAPEVESSAAEKLAAAAVVASLAGEQETPPAQASEEELPESPLPEILAVAAVEEVAQPAAESAIPPEEETAPLVPEAAVELPMPETAIPQEEVLPAEVAAESSLAEARHALSQGQPAQAAGYYASLIKQNYHLDEIIKDLQEAIYRFPVDTDMWVTLGDAHSKKSDLQEALNAYIKAEELVR